MGCRNIFQVLSTVGWFYLGEKGWLTVCPSNLVQWVTPDLWSCEASAWGPQPLSLTFHICVISVPLMSFSCSASVDALGRTGQLGRLIQMMLDTHTHTQLPSNCLWQLLTSWFVRGSISHAGWRFQSCLSDPSWCYQWELSHQSCIVFTSESKCQVSSLLHLFSYCWVLVLFTLLLFYQFNFFPHPALVSPDSKEDILF